MGLGLLLRTSIGRDATGCITWIASWYYKHILHGKMEVLCRFEVLITSFIIICSFISDLTIICTHRGNWTILWKITILWPNLTAQFWFLLSNHVQPPLFILLCRSCRPMNLNTVIFIPLIPKRLTNVLQVPVLRMWSGAVIYLLCRNRLSNRLFSVTILNPWSQQKIIGVS